MERDDQLIRKLQSEKGSLSARLSTLDTELSSGQNAAKNEALRNVLNDTKSSAIYTMDKIRIDAKSTETKSISCVANLSAEFEGRGAHKDITYTVQKSSSGDLVSVGGL